MQKFWDGSASSHDTEHGQEQVPERQDTPHFEPGPGCHDLLAGKDQDQVDAARVETDGSPVSHHPGFGLCVFKISLEIENVGIVGTNQKVAGYRQRI